jgi:CheY-like chemotaxis protein
MRTRQLLLERVGHTVVKAVHDKELVEACTLHKFDVALVGQSLSANAKKRAAALVREHCPDTKVLELYSASRGRALDDADSWLEVPADVPQDLADRVTKLAKAT